MEMRIEIDARSDESGRRHACGILITDTLAARPVHQGGHLLQSAQDPDAAMYDALVRSLELAGPLKPSDVEILCASTDLIEQITGGAEPPARLADSHRKVLGLLLKFDAWRLIALEPDLEPSAARLARQALEEAADRVELDAPTAAQRQLEIHTGVPQWTVELTEEPGSACPAQCAAGRRYPFGPETPAGLCVYAAQAALEDGPLHWSDTAQRRMSTSCPACGTPLEIRRLGPENESPGGTCA